MNYLETDKFNTLNVFVDASVKQTANKEFFTSYGARILQGREAVAMTAYTCPGTNNFGEANAIRLGILMVLEYMQEMYDPRRPMRYRINLFSDSKINLMGIRDWIFNWIYHQDSMGVLISTSGTPVANQNILLEIVSLIIRNNLTINLYHQAGHCTNEKTIFEGKQVFKRSNGITLTDAELRFICENNNIIDDFTRTQLDMTQLIPSNIGFYLTPTRREMNTYRKLINKVQK